MENNSNADGSLNANIVKLSATLEKIHSYKFTFLRGIVLGIGTFVGATIIATILITILVQVLGVLGIGSFIESFIPSGE